MTDSRKKVLVLGVHSFLDQHVKVGIQYIAEWLAKTGWQVDYLSIFSSLFDFYGSRRRMRFKRVWLERQDQHGKPIAANLKEYAFRAPFPAHRQILRYGWQERLYGEFRPNWLDNRCYDLCIHDVTANVLYLEWVRSTITVLRLNDLPEGFGHALSARIISGISNRILTGQYDDIWSAHEPLTRHTLSLNPTNRVATIPNGVDDYYLSVTLNQPRRPRSAVYLGNIEQWVDLTLIDKTAMILDDWQFDIIGPLNRPWTNHASNVRMLPPITRADVMPVLSRYRVGLIPFREISGRLAFVERPLKFFEYIAAGLGVACTDLGSLKSGLGDLASYGNTPRTFADAIRRESDRASKRSKERCLEIVGPHAWSNVMKTINHRLEHLGLLNRAR